MRWMAMLALGLVLTAGLGASYVMYRQLDMGIVALEASPQFERNEEGGLCAEVHLVVEARTLARWLLPVEDGQTFSGVVTVQGNEGSDIGFRIRSPTNRLVLFEPGRTHRQEFEVAPAIRGDYGFEFDNRHSTFTEKRVTVSVCLA